MGSWITASLAAVAIFSMAGSAAAHSISQKVGGYSDNEGMTRQREELDSSIDGKVGQTLSASTYTLSLVRDAYQSDNSTASEYLRQIYGSGSRLNRQATVSATQTYDRVTETRALVSYGTDDVVKVRTWSVGASEWYNHETVRLAIDVSRTIVDQPVYEILDYDSRSIGNPTVTTAAGATLGLRHLATPTTLVDYTLAWLEADNRPATQTGSVAIRQFVTPLHGAIHGGLARSLNRGYIDTNSTYGQVDAWQGDAAWVQNLWTGGLARIAYRYYKEDETTRAYADEKVFGSDTTTFGISQEFKMSGGVPVTLDAATGRYASNIGVSARTYEAGMTARF